MKELYRLIPNLQKQLDDEKPSFLVQLYKQVSIRSIFMKIGTDHDSSDSSFRPVQPMPVATTFPV